MLSEWMAVLLLAAGGMAFDAAVQVISRSRQSINGKVLALSITNGAFVFGVLVACYMVDGFTVRGEWGEGWLDWVTLVEGFLAGYAWILAASLWRFVTEAER